LPVYFPIALLERRFHEPYPLLRILREGDLRVHARASRVPMLPKDRGEKVFCLTLRAERPVAAYASMVAEIDHEHAGPAALLALDDLCHFQVSFVASGSSS